MKQGLLEQHPCSGPIGFHKFTPMNDIKLKKIMIALATNGDEGRVIEKVKLKCVHQKCFHYLGINE